MPSIKRTGPKPQTTPTAQRRSVASCGPATPTERAVSSCGGWVSKSTRTTGKAVAEKKADTTPPGKQAATVSSCGGAGWSRYGKIPSSC